MPRHLSFILSAFVVFQRNADAQPHQPSTAHEQHEPIEVTVRGEPSTEAFISHASVNDSLRSPIDAASLLEDLPSVHVRRLGADGSFATLSVRGSASTQVGVFLSGIPLTSGADPSFDIGSFPLWPGAGFRVYRSFAPASLGTTGYLGGVLSIEPPSLVNGARTEWWTAAGSFGALKLRVGDTRRVGNIILGTALFAARSDGDFSYECRLSDEPDAPTRGCRPEPGSVRTTIRRNAGFVSVGGIERASLEFDWGSASALVLADARRQGLPGSAQSPPTLLTRLSSERTLVGIDAIIRTGERGALRALVWGRHEQTSVADPAGELGLRSGPSFTDDRLDAVGGSVSWRGRLLSPLLASITMDLRREGFSPHRQPDASRQIAAHRFGGGAGGDAEWTLLRSPQGSLAAVVSGRLDARHDSTETPRNGSPLAASTELAPSGHGGLSYQVGPYAVISAHAGALRRSPGFVELYGDRGALIGNPSLRPERALTIDTGVHGDVPNQGLHFHYELVGFMSSVTDLIVFVPRGYDDFRAENIEHASLLGAELTASLKFRSLQTTLGYSLLYTRNTTENPLLSGRPLPGRPLHDFAYEAAYRIGPMQIRYDLNAIAGTTVDEGATIVLPERVLHSIGSKLDLPYAKGLSASVDIDNLFDVRSRYVSSPLRTQHFALPLSDFLGFPLPGRTFWFSLQWVHQT